MCPGKGGIKSEVGEWLWNRVWGGSHRSHANHVNRSHVIAAVQHLHSESLGLSIFKPCSPNSRSIVDAVPPGAFAGALDPRG